MQKKTLLTTLATLIVASIFMSAIAISNTTYTWEKTFEVTKPKIECEIEVSDCRVIGCPVKIWVCLKLDDECGECCWRQYKEHWKDECDCCKERPECREHWKCCSINGTYSARLFWWNETSEDWQYVVHLQEETNITIGCWKYMKTYFFIPKWEGEYKVEVMFTVDSEIFSFTSED